MEEFDFRKMRVIYPNTAEEMLLAIGAKEGDQNIEIILTTEVVANICVRLVRIEDRLREWEEIEEEGEEDE